MSYKINSGSITYSSYMVSLDFGNSLDKIDPMNSMNNFIKPIERCDD